ncbi:hypothetical protein ACFFJK_14800 [Massilia consociata]|uniref:Glycosyltransferase family 1 protein n=2 Tax=Massilia consociata TaxID=760117 RepID=A0ABV6FI11_9BURK
MTAKLNPVRLLARLFKPREEHRIHHESAKTKPTVGLLSSSDTASITYLLRPYLSKLGQRGVIIDTETGVAEDGLPATYNCVVIVRYLPSEWVQPLQEFRASGGRVIYFMDDDLMDPLALKNLPASYEKKIRKFAVHQRTKLESICDEFWVSTQYLAEKYYKWRPTLLLPGASIGDIAVEGNMCSICYHGTASHKAELEWLVSIFSSVQRGNDETRVEVFGDHQVNRMYRQIPRVAVLHPMSWPSYLAYTSAIKHDIGLAPLLPDPFNAARGPTKFFDFARMGAVGIYSNVAPYRDFIQDGVDGILLPNEPELWVETILDLSLDTQRRQRMRAAARERAQSMTWDGPLKGV